MKRAYFDGALWALTALQTLACAPLLLRKWRRFKRRRDSYEWDMARWRGEWVQTPDANWIAKTGPHFVFYADGFAETRLAVQLGRELLQKRPNWRFSLAIRNLRDTREGHAIPADWPVSALPFDYFPAVRNWFKARPPADGPAGVVMIEKLFYPNFVRGCASLGAAVIGVNSYARASDCSENQRFKRWILCGFTYLGLRSETQKTLLEPLLEVGCFEVSGSLKFPTPRAENSLAKNSPAESPTDAGLEAWLQSAAARPLLAAGSVEIGEVEVLCHALSLLRATTAASLIWAPRHIESAGDLQVSLEKHGFKSVLRSHFRVENGEKAAAIDFVPDVLILDSMGELASLYARCEGAFVGGSFAGGGHNVLEPLASEVPVVFGPKRGFFAAEQEFCEAEGVGRAVGDARELAVVWREMLENQAYRAQVRTRIAPCIAQGQQSWGRTLQLLLEKLDAIADNERGANEFAAKLSSFLCHILFTFSSFFSTPNFL